MFFIWGSTDAFEHFRFNWKQTTHKKTPESDLIYINHITKLSYSGTSVFTSSPQHAESDMTSGPHI